jgi:hypothetical protein
MKEKGMPRFPFPSIGESFARLHQAGWSIGETVGGGGWLVIETDA